MTYSVEQHIELRRLVEIACAPGGDWLAVTVQRLDREKSRYRLGPVEGSGRRLGRRAAHARDGRDASPCFRRDGSLAFLSNRQPIDVKPDEEADKRMQVWLLPAPGGEPQQLTDEPLGVAAFRFARAADRLVLLAPVLPGVALEQQRTTASEQRKHGPSGRRLSRQAGTPLGPVARRRRTQRGDPPDRLSGCARRADRRTDRPDAAGAAPVRHRAGFRRRIGRQADRDHARQPRRGPVRRHRRVVDRSRQRSRPRGGIRSARQLPVAAFLAGRAHAVRGAQRSIAAACAAPDAGTDRCGERGARAVRGRLGPLAH